MIERSVLVATSLEARTAALFVQTASRYSSSVKIEVENKIVNAKSIMGIISLGILDGQVVKIVADGTDEDKVVLELEKFLAKP